MAQAKFRIGITRDNLKPNGKPIFDESAFKILGDPRIEYEFLPEIEPELTPETAAKYDALAVMLAKVTRKTVSVPAEVVGTTKEMKRFLASPLGSAVTGSGATAFWHSSGIPSWGSTSWDRPGPGTAMSQESGLWLALQSRASPCSTSQRSRCPLELQSQLGR